MATQPIAPRVGATFPTQTPTATPNANSDPISINTQPEQIKLSGSRPEIKGTHFILEKCGEKT